MDSRFEKIAAAFEIELLELFSFGEKNVFYLVVAAANNYYYNNSFNNCKNNLYSTDSSNEKHELEHELEKAGLLLQQKDKEIAYLKKINRLMKN